MAYIWDLPLTFVSRKYTSTSSNQDAIKYISIGIYKTSYKFDMATMSGAYNKE